MVSAMQTYHNNPAVKEKYLARVRAHREAGDEMYDPKRYETEIGIPMTLGRLEERIFENLPLESAVEWPERFLAAVPVGRDLGRVPWQFLHWLLTDSDLLHDGGIENVRQTIHQAAAVIEPATRGQTIDTDAAESVFGSASGSAASSGNVAAWYAATSARHAVEAGIRGPSENGANVEGAAMMAALSSKFAADENSEVDAWYDMADKLVEMMTAIDQGDEHNGRPAGQAGYGVRSESGGL